MRHNLDTTTLILARMASTNSNQFNLLATRCFGSVRRVFSSHPRAILFILGIVAWFACLEFPDTVLTAELDPSWAGVGSEAHAAGARFGVDIVYTYGPIGFLITGQYSPHGYAWQCAWAIGSCLLGIAILGIAAAKLPSPWKWLLLPGIALAPTDLPLLACLAGTLVIADGKRNSSLAAALLTLPFFILLPLVKFTYAMGIGASLGALGILLAVERRWKFLSGYFLLIMSGIVLVWKWNGQMLGDLPTFVISSLEVAKGYPASMALPSEPTLLVACCFVALGAILCSFPWIPFPSKSKFLNQPFLLVSAAMFAGILLAWSFLVWKHGMTRFSVGHTQRLLTLLPFIGVLGLLRASPGRIGIWRQAAITVGILSSLVALQLLGVLPSVSTATTAARIQKNCHILTNPSGHEQSLKTALDDERAKASLPEVGKAIGDSSVDIFGNAQALAILNGFNYAPRPAFQSYSAYTPALAKLNNDYFLAADRPEYVLFCVDVFNNRFPPLDDPLLWPNLLETYDPVLVEKNSILLRKTSRSPHPPVLLESTRVALGAPLSLSQYAGKNLYLKFDFSPTLLGSLKGLAYKPPLTVLKVTKADGAVPRNEFLFSYVAASSGCVISPLLTDINDVTGWLAGVKSCRPLEIAVDTMDPHDRGFFHSFVGVQIYEFPPPPAQNAPLYREMIPRLAFKMFEVPPVSYSCPGVPKPMRFAKEDFLLLPPPSEMVWKKPDHARFFHGKLALRLPPGSLGQKSDGANFSVHWRPTGQTDSHILAEWKVDPKAKSGTRAPIAFSLALPPEEGEVVVRAEAGENENSEGDYTGWARLGFED